MAIPLVPPQHATHRIVASIPSTPPHPVGKECHLIESESAYLDPDWISSHKDDAQLQEIHLEEAMDFSPGTQVKIVQLIDRRIAGNTSGPLLDERHVLYRVATTHKTHYRVIHPTVYTIPISDIKRDKQPTAEEPLAIGDVCTVIATSTQSPVTLTVDATVVITEINSNDSEPREILEVKAKIVEDRPMDVQYIIDRDLAHQELRG